MHRGPTTIRRLPSLILPLACHISAVKAKIQYTSITDDQVEIFGAVKFWMLFALPGQGPFPNIMHNATSRHLRNATPRKGRSVMQIEPRNRVGFNADQRRVELLDLYVMSNSSKARVELMVDRCIQSATEDFSDPQPLLEEG